MKDTVEYIKLQVALAVAYARQALSTLAERPWFPKRKVIAAALSAFVTSFLVSKLGLDPSLDGQAIISGAAAFAVAWLIPERQS